MKNQYKMLVTTAFFVMMALTMPTAPLIAKTEQCDSIIAEQAKIFTHATNKIIQTMNRTKISKEKAAEIIVQARKDFMAGKKTLRQLTKILRTQNAAIAHAEQNLKHVMDRMSKRVETNERSYRSFSPRRKKINRSADTQDIAARLSKNLQDQKEALIRDYKQAKKEITSPEQERELQNRYRAIIKQLNADISAQECITGEIVTTKKREFGKAIKRAQAVIDIVVPSGDSVSGIDLQEDIKLHTYLQQAAADAHERTTILNKKMATEQDLDTLYIQQEELQKHVQAKQTEHQRLEREHHVAQQELDLLHEQQEKLRKDAEMKAAEKARLENEERVLLDLKQKEAEQELHNLHREQEDILRSVEQKQVDHMRLKEQQDAAAVDVVQLKEHDQDLQQQIITSDGQQHQLAEQQMDLEQARNAIEQELHALKIREQELQQEAEYKAFEQLRLEFVQHMAIVDREMLQERHQECENKIAKSMEVRDHLEEQHNSIEGQLHELARDTQRIQAKIDAKKAEKAQLKLEEEMSY
jgi:hypothetical protein